MKKYCFFFLQFLLTSIVYSQETIQSSRIKLVDKLIFLELSINESEEPLNFLFDTGAGITVIDSATSQKLKLKITDEAKIGTSGKIIKAGLSTNNKINISKNLILDDITVAIMDLSHIGKYLKTELDGIIGNELLEKFIVETNMDSKEIRFYSNTGFNYSGNVKPLSLIGLESGHLGIQLEVVFKRKTNPKTLIFKIDTGGDNYLTFHNSAVKKYELLDPNKKYKIKQGFGAESTISHNFRGKIASAILGKREWKNFPVVFEVDELNQTTKREADGLICQAMLIDFNITYDLKGGLVYFENRELKMN